MSSPVLQPESSNRHFRIDPEHHVREMMQAALAHLHHCQVDIRMHEDAVLLTGNVDSWSDKQIAQESIRAISGMRTIQNNLRVV